jgi:hypothetical protein
MIAPSSRVAALGALAAGSTTFSAGFGFSWRGFWRAGYCLPSLPAEGVSG